MCNVSRAEWDNRHRDEDLRAWLFKHAADLIHAAQQLDPESRQHWDSMRRERDEARNRLRVTAQICIEYVGASGPMNAEDAARAAVERAQKAERKLDQARQVLKQLEWSREVLYADDDGVEHSADSCPICGMVGGHSEDCTLLKVMLP
jgi:flavin-binding protein dodecin